jgi:hypothetical protein
MATYFNKNDENPIYSQEITGGKFTGSWEDKSGKVVEDYITRRLKEAHDSEIVGGSYADEWLHLQRADGKNIDINVTVAPATYDYDMVFYGIRVDGVLCTEPDLLMQYKESPTETKVEAGIAIRSVASVLENVSNNNSTFQVTFEFNGYRITQPVRNIDKEYFTYSGQLLTLNIPEGQTAEDIVAWVDVSEIFKRRATSKEITASFTPAKIGDNVPQKVSKTLSTKITNEVINLIYGGDVIIKQNTIEV